MTQKTHVSSRRLGLLLRNEMLRGYKNIFIIAGAIIGVLLIVNVSSAGTSDQWDFHSIFFPITLLCGGIIAASRSFSVLYNKERSTEYLLLPASMFEKYLAKLIFSTAGYVLIALAGYFLFSVLGSALSVLFLDNSHGLFNPFTREVWQVIALYTVTGSVVFFGSVYFKKLPLIKTVLVLNGLALVYAIFAVVMFRLLFWGYFEGFTVVTDEVIDLFRIQAGVSSRFLNFFESAYRVLKVMFWYIMPAFFWILTFIRLKESEVK